MPAPEGLQALPKRLYRSLWGSGTRAGFFRIRWPAPDKTSWQCRNGWPRKSTDNLMYRGGFAENPWTTPCTGASSVLCSEPAFLLVRKSARVIISPNDSRQCCAFVAHPHKLLDNDIRIVVPGKLKLKDCARAGDRAGLFRCHGRVGIGAKGCSDRSSATFDCNWRSALDPFVFHCYTPFTYDELHPFDETRKLARDWLRGPPLVAAARRLPAGAELELRLAADRPGPSVAWCDCRRPR